MNQTPSSWEEENYNYISDLIKFALSFLTGEQIKETDNYYEFPIENLNLNYTQKYNLVE